MDGFPPTPPKDTGDRLDPDDLPDVQVTQPFTQDHDEGLHLMYDYPRSVTDNTSSTQPFPSSSQPLKIDVTPEGDISPPRQRTIRFRSRVRITSGVHSVSSSHGSPSSSISVPLHGPHGPDVSMSTASPSGRLPSAAAANAWLSNLSSSHKASSVRRERRRNSASPHSPHVDERTPLASASQSGSRRSYTEQSEDEVEDDADPELDRLRAAARKSEEQVMFGKWPWRVFNRHVCPPQFHLFAHPLQLFFSGGGGRLNLSCAAAPTSMMSPI